MRILIVDDHQLFRAGLRLVLDQQPDLEVIGEAGSGPSALEAIEKLSPELVLMDVGLPGLDGAETTRQALRRCPGLRIVALSMYAEAFHVSRMLQAGVIGYVLKENAAQDVVDALRAASQNRYFLSAQVLCTVLKDYVHRLPAGGASAAALLSPKERQVLQRIAEGQTTKQIALTLGTSVKTVETHRKRLMDKLNLDSVAALTKFAIREGLIAD